MTAKTLPSIGDLVTYHRNIVNPETQANELIEGNGVVVALHLNTDKRYQVQVKDGESFINIDAVMINATEDEKIAYSGMIAVVDDLTKEGNEEVQKVVSDYNSRIQTIYTSVLGAPLSV